MSSTTMKAKCPQCDGDDCNYTIESGYMGNFRVMVDIEYCNTCSYHSERLLVDGAEVAKKVEHIQPKVKEVKEEQ